MGTPEFAVPCLDILLKNGYDIVGVVTATDKLGGRGGKQLIQSAVKQYALANNLPVLQPEKLKNSEFIESLKALNADIFIVVAFRMLPEIVWTMPRFGTMNLHGSLLPKYRGAAPINWAIINGEKETGVTTFFLKHEIDTGDVLFRASLPIGDDENAGEIHDKMMVLGAETVLKSVKAVESGNFTLQPQLDTVATHAPKIFLETCQINFNQNTEGVHNFVRGLSPYPTAWTMLDSLKLKVFKTEKELKSLEHIAGELISDNKNYLKVATKDGYIHLLDVQLEGKKRMYIKDFLNGYKLESFIFEWVTKEGTKRDRIRQTKTSFQKAFTGFENYLQPFSWHERIPEFLHISIALVEFDFIDVEKDFIKIINYINQTQPFKEKFHFNLSHTIKIIKEDKNLLNVILDSCFKTAFEQLYIYNEILEIDIDIDIENMNMKPELLFKGYKQILDGRSDNSILCKYLMLKNDQKDLIITHNLLNFTTKNEILKPDNVSQIMAAFPPSIGLSENFDLSFCEQIWFFNYTNIPFIDKPDESENENQIYHEMKIDEYLHEFKQIYSEFRNINLLYFFPRGIMEIIIGFNSRICNLSIDVVDLVKSHKGEIAELTTRSILENFIIATWLIKERDAKLFQRFREFSLGKDKYITEKLTNLINIEPFKEKLKENLKENTKKEGRNSFDIASERGDMFELNLSQISDKVWGEDNMYYLIYKRLSETTHGNWRAIDKYHLSTSLNPIHNGLKDYNENPNRFCGLTPIFTTLGISTKFMIGILDELEDIEAFDEIKIKLGKFNKNIQEQFTTYNHNYILSRNF